MLWLLETVLGGLLVLLAAILWFGPIADWLGGFNDDPQRDADEARRAAEEKELQQRMAAEIAGRPEREARLNAIVERERQLREAERKRSEIALL